MNRISAKSLLHSKWTKSSVANKEKHFVIVDVERDDTQKITRCVIQAVINQHEYTIDWHELKNSSVWKLGWQ